MNNPKPINDPLSNILYHLQGDTANYMLENVPHPVFLSNEGSLITHCNQAFCTLLSVDRSHLLGKSLSTFLSDPTHEHLSAIDRHLWLSGGEQSFQATIVTSHTEIRVLITQKRMDIGDQKVAFIGTVLDLTPIKKSNSSHHSLTKYTELMLKINQSLLEKTSEQALMDFIMTELYEVFGHNDCGCLLANREGHLKMVSQVGYTEEAMLSFDIRVEESYFWRYAKGDINRVYLINQIDLIEQEDYSKVATAKNGAEMISSISAPLIIDGQLYGLINFDSPVRNAFTQEQVTIMEYVRTQLSIAIKNMQLYERIIKLSRYDQLTGLMNRHYFEECITLKMIENKKLGKALIIVVCDVDNLKQVNDHLGHLEGDQLLKACANTINSVFHSNALVARFGGDEFVAAISDSDEHTLSLALEEDRRLLMTHKVGKWPYSFSFGMSCMTADDETYFSILKRADKAMYHEKEFRMKGRRSTDHKNHP